jgi:hypothetical protein
MAAPHAVTKARVSPHQPPASPICAKRIQIRRPHFAPTVLDGGKTGTDTGDVGQQFLIGFLRAKAIQDLLKNAGVAADISPRSLTFLAGPSHAANTRDGLAGAFKTMQPR